MRLSARRSGVARCRLRFAGVTETEPLDVVGDTKERLLAAGERLFAREGIHRVPLREINALAGQRNPSALHYHFGSREGLVEAIMLRHQEAIEAAMSSGIDELEQAGDVGIRDIVTVVVRPLAAKLDSASGRDFLRILPQVSATLGRNLRRGVMAPSTPQSTRVLELLQERMGHVPGRVQRERQVGYVLILSMLLAERAHEIEDGRQTTLDRAEFEDHLIDTIEAVLSGPSSVG